MDVNNKRGIKVTTKLTYRALIDITSLVDMTFLLVAFFMVTSSFGTISSIVVHLPKAVESKDLQSSNVVITINEHNEVFINDVKYQLADILEEIKKKKDAIGDNPVIIRGDRKASYETIISVMDIVKQAGIPRFTLATVKTR